MKLARILLTLALAAPLPALAQTEDEGRAEDVVLYPPGYEAALAAGDLTAVIMIIRPAADACERDNKATGACFLLFLGAAAADLELTMKVGGGRDSEAARSVPRAYDYLLPIVRKDPEMFGMISSLKGKLRLFERRYSEAEALFRDAYGANVAIVPRDDKAIIGALGNLAVAIAKQGREQDAIPLYRESLALARAAGELDMIETIKISLATSLNHSGFRVEAEALYRETLATAETKFGADHPALARHLSNLAVTLDAMGRHKEAEALHRRALAIRSKADDYDEMRISRDLLADNLLAQRRYAEAEVFAVGVFNATGGRDLGDPERSGAAEQLGTIWSYMTPHLPGARTLLADAMQGRIVEASDRPGFDAESQFTMTKVKPIAARRVAVAWALAHR
ncbi:tetratricopeptide repeat protein [Sphingomonas sp. LT1P40]|uniref:tetratricopeptide repeat protein n=1 Tax=Alteristakelama amylovorans TaxID=3096166 RepID=UPI002FC8DE6E